MAVPLASFNSQLCLAETARISAQGERDAIRIKAEGKAAEILMIAQAEKDAGALLGSSPNPFIIRYT